MKSNVNVRVVSAVDLTDRTAIAAYAAKMFASYKGNDLDVKESAFIAKLEAFVNPQDDTTPKVILIRTELEGLNPEFFDSAASMVETATKEREDGKIVSPFSLPEGCDTWQKAVDYIDEHIAAGREPMMFLLTLKDAYNCVGELICKSDAEVIKTAALTLRDATLKLEVELVSKDTAYTRNGKTEVVEKSHLRNTFELIKGSARLEKLIDTQFQESLKRVSNFSRKGRKAEVSKEDQIIASIKWNDSVPDNTRRKAVEDFLSKAEEGLTVVEYVEMFADAAPNLVKA